MVTAPMPEALDESTPLLGRSHRTTPRWSDYLITQWPSHLAIPQLSNQRTTSRLSNHLESLSRAEKGMDDSNLDLGTLRAFMKTFALCVVIVPNKDRLETL